ncbi:TRANSCRIPTION FACTOR C2H2 FAMILY-RELATED [Salix viminalis]|uniref:TRANSCRIPTION FACTOR C2H2 FAMILY-RELATED n=1 Tax=Salix viminalis TaxID=40686 RepID=A0A9Q0TYI2_SALVM|nr:TRANSCRIPTION FACTOR C2H2 FAMILY-RELATED [Salix viminalis]
MNGGRPEDSSAKDFGGFALIFGVSIGVLSAIAMVIFVYYFFITRKAIPAARFHGDGSSSDDDSVAIGIGLDEATLDTYPKLLYSEAKKKLGNGGDSAAASTCSCSICLADYTDSDLLRLLPDCDHLFPFSVHRSMVQAAYYLPRMSKLAFQATSARIPWPMVSPVCALKGFAV